MSPKKANPDDAQLDLSVEEIDEPTAEHDAVDDAVVIDAAATEVLVDVAEADPEGGEDGDAEGGDSDGGEDDGSVIARLDWEGASIDASDALL